MENCIRQNERETVNFDVTVQWEDAGQSCSGKFRVCDVSDGGLQIEGTERIEAGKPVRIDVAQYGFPLEAAVRYCASAGDGLSIGLEFCSETRRSILAAKEAKARCEVLQVSPRADRDTVHRVFRINHSLLGRISSGICENASTLQHVEFERLRGWAALGEIVSDLKDRISHRAGGRRWSLGRDTP